MLNPWMTYTIKEDKNLNLRLIAITLLNRFKSHDNGCVDITEKEDQIFIQCSNKQNTEAALKFLTSNHITWN
jgi:hypothetical protein